VTSPYSVLDLLAAPAASNLVNPDVAEVARRLKLKADTAALAGASLGSSREAIDRLLHAGLLPDALPAEQQDELARRLRTDRNGLPRAIAADPDVVVTFLGLPAPHEDPPTPVPQGASPAYPLFPHQRRALADVQQLLRDGHERAVLHMPTGAGKTRTAMNLVCDRLRASDRGAVLWLASTQELLEQGAHEFARAWSHLGNRDVAIHAAWGGRRWNPAHVTDGLLVASPQTLYAGLKSAGPMFLGRLGRQLQLIVFDEAHQAIADTYRDVTERLAAAGLPITPVVGLTATPGRTFVGNEGDDELAEFFHHNKVMLDTSAEGGPSNPVSYLIENGYLAKPTFVLLGELPEEAAGEPTYEGEDDSDITMDRHDYLELVVGTAIDLVNEGHIRLLVFAASVDLALAVAGALRAANIQAEAVHASTHPSVRDTAIRAYKTRTRDPRVLVNYGVLTTGFDAPETSAAIIARPTRSLVLYSQMVGRAIRGVKAGGNERSTVATVVDPGVPAFGSIADAFAHWEDHWEVDN
jgi:DNA repair protein RadD